MAAGLLAAAVALALVNLVALPGLGALLPPVIALPMLICIPGPAIEEACKYAAFRLLLRPARRGWRAYWALGLTFGVLEALLKLAPLVLMPSPETSAVSSLPAITGEAFIRGAGGLASLLLHSALGGVVAVVAPRRGGRMGVTLAAVLHVAFNTIGLLAVLALGGAAGETGAQLGVWLALVLAFGLLLLPFHLAASATRRPLAAAPPIGAA